MPDLLTILTNLSWPVAICIAWLAGEFGQRLTSLPRISFYGLVGFALANSQLGVLPPAEGGPALVLADVAFGLILFELGYRINLRWLRTNPWFGAAALAEALATFVAIYLVATAFNIAVMTALMMAALSMATSPATVVRVINEMRSSGQVTERVLHLSALNCVLAVFAFNVVVGFWIFHNSEDLGDATLNSLVALLTSAASGAIFGVVVPALLRRLGNLAQDATVGFALAVILLVAITYSAQLSPVVATLAFGLTARHRRVAFSQAQRNFGALGEVLTVLLFVVRRLDPAVGQGDGRRRAGPGRDRGAPAGQDAGRDDVFAPVRDLLAQGGADRRVAGARVGVRDPAARARAPARGRRGRGARGDGGGDDAAGSVRPRHHPARPAAGARNLGDLRCPSNRLPNRRR